MASGSWKRSRKEICLRLSVNTVLITHFRLLTCRTGKCYSKPLNLWSFIIVTIRNKYTVFWNITFLWHHWVLFFLNNSFLNLLAKKYPVSLKYFACSITNIISSEIFFVFFYLKHKIKNNLVIWLKGVIIPLVPNLTCFLYLTNNYN